MQLAAFRKEMEELKRKLAEDEASRRRALMEEEERLKVRDYPIVRSRTRTHTRTNESCPPLLLCS